MNGIQGHYLIIERRSEPVGSLEIVESLLDASGHRLLSLSDPDSRVVVLLVRLVGAIRVTDLRLEVCASQIGPIWSDSQSCLPKK